MQVKNIIIREGITRSKRNPHFGRTHILIGDVEKPEELSFIFLKYVWRELTLNNKCNLDREKNIHTLTNIYWIGGSPCCGKSTIAELLVKEFGFILYKCDDYLDRYIEKGAAVGIDIMKKFKSMNKDETWLHRGVEQQVQDEFEYYRYALKIIKEELIRNYSEGNILVEGAAILPEFIKSEGIDYNKYVCIVPTKEFQIDKYSKREWVKGYLSDSSYPEKAFKNWMERDSRFAQIIMKNANDYKMNVITVDGNKSIGDNYLKVRQIFGLVLKVMDLE